jgi:hypothetical protein
MKPLHFALVDHGRVLATRTAGREAAARILELLGERRPLVLNFKGVEAVTPPFLDEVLGAVQTAVGENDETCVVVFFEPNPDVRETLEFVLLRRKVPMVELHRTKVDLVAGISQLAKTLEAAQRLGEFTAPELAEELSLKLTTTNQRLKTLTQARAIARHRDRDAAHGKRYRYASPSPAALVG